MSTDWVLPPPKLPPPFAHLEPIETLYSVGGEAWIFTSVDPDGRLLLAYLVEDLDGGDGGPLSRFIVAPTSVDIVDDLRLGAVSVRDALTRTWLWVVDVSDAGDVVAAYSCEADDVPVDALPNRSVMLLASLQPALSLRFSGPEIVPGRLPASVVSRAGSSAPKALGKLAAFVAGALTADFGRPPEWLRRVYNLPVQQLRYGSFEISFRLPSEVEGFQGDMTLGSDESQAVLYSEMAERTWRMLRAGLEWVKEGAEGEVGVPERGGDRERLAILEALKELIPNSPSITSVAIGGRGVGSTTSQGEYNLGQKQAVAVRRAYREVRARVEGEAVYEVFNGLIRDLDLDKKSFVLRKPDALDSSGERFVLTDEELLEVAREAHYGVLGVSVVGRRARDIVNDPWLATNIEIGDGVVEVV